MNVEEIRDAIRTARALGSNEDRCPHCFSTCIANIAPAAGEHSRDLEKLECCDCGARQMTMAELRMPLREPSGEECITGWWRGKNDPGL